MPSDVKLIQQDGDANLMEWRDADGLHREILPQQEDAEPGTGIPYGVKWSELSAVINFPQRLEHELHELGIWTWNDFNTHPNEARRAVLRASLQEMKKESAT